MKTRSPRGILPYQHIKQLIAKRVIRADIPIEDRQLQPASLDLRLGTKAYRLISSFLPELSEITSRLNVLDFYQSDLVMYEMDLTEGAILEKGHVYLVPLLESVSLPDTIRARSNPKSTTGRLDVFTRVVTDLNAGFDEIRAGYHGPLYLEIVPRSFTIKVKTGYSLNQIRFVQRDAMVADRALRGCIIPIRCSITTRRPPHLSASAIRTTADCSSASISMGMTGVNALSSDIAPKRTATSSIGRKSGITRRWISGADQTDTPRQSSAGTGGILYSGLKRTHSRPPRLCGGNGSIRSGLRRVADTLRGLF